MISSEKPTLQIGIIMPISSIDGCTVEHWAEVKAIIEEAVGSITQFTVQARIVSEADEVGVIQKRIVQNLYSADIVVCDVSCKNANVMFELGMRLAFDKPTVIIKDEITNYAFDTGIIEHLEYPRDLRFAKIVEFKSKLARKVIATYEESLRNPDHSTFLKNFGEFKVATLVETAVSPDNLILEMLMDIQHDVAVMKRDRKRNTISNSIAPRRELSIIVRNAIQTYLDNRMVTLQDLDNAIVYDLIKSVVSYVESRIGKNDNFNDSYVLDTLNYLIIEHNSMSDEQIKLMI